ncbi:MAG TPA: MoaD/ThiS family protein [Symbiobacteriaceae bacterium]|jgi:molybdopterin converting factor small subunit|nr:MoaD/ThiS family protein [Symbiobacteriaceae bacterium]
MITVRLFGTLRLDAKRRSLTVEASTVAAMLSRVAAELAVPGRVLEQAVVFVNGEKATLRTRLRDGDEVYLLSPAAGG